MFVRSANPAAYTLQSRVVQEPVSAASQSTDKSSSTKTASSSVQLFSNGQFVGASQLSSPATLAALFQLNDDGTVKHGDLGGPALKKGVRLDTSQEHMAKFLAMGPPETWSASDRAVANDLSKITSDDKAMFRQVTGYNLFISGPAVMIVDDEGNPPPAKEAAAVDELFQRMRYTRESGGEIDGDWFSGISQDLKTWSGPTFPTDWASKADDWFDQVFENRASLVSREAAVGGSAMPKSTVDAAISAYAEGMKLASPIAVDGALSNS